MISIENELGISGFPAFQPEYGHGTPKRRTEAFFGIGSGVQGCEGPYNRSIGPEETTVRNGEGLSGRRAIGHRRRGRSDTYGYPDCL